MLKSLRPSSCIALATAIAIASASHPLVAADMPAGKVGADPKPDSQERRLLVVAPKSLAAAARPFVKVKNQAIPTELVQLESILKSTEGVDDPEKLKRYLFDAWKNGGVGYVLLVGDVDLLPVRYMVLDRVTPAAFDYAFYPSDLYYADVAQQDGTFDDWNRQKEGFHAAYFGEVRGEKNKSEPINYDAVDYRPEIAVGRWPVSTPEHVRLVAEKTLKYERGIATGKKPGQRSAGLFAVGGWVDSRGVMDRFAASLPAGWSATKRYYRDEQNPKAQPPTTEEVTGMMNTGAGLLIHAGHGQTNAWEQCLHVSNLPQVKNSDRLPIVLSAGCSTAYFAPLPPYDGYIDASGQEHKGTDAGEKFASPPPPPSPYQRGRFNPTGLGEQILRASPNGAVAYFGCNTGSQPCGLTLLEGFGDSLKKSQSPRLGDLWKDAVSYYYEKERLADLKPDSGWYPPSIFFQGMKFMLFGDPTLPLPSPE